MRRQGKKPLLVQLEDSQEGFGGIWTVPRARIFFLPFENAPRFKS